MHNRIRRSSTPVERNTREAKPVASPYSSLDGSEDALPFKVREALLNSNEIEILVAEENYKEEPIEKFMVQGFPIWGNRNITVEDEATRGLLVDGLLREMKFRSSGLRAKLTFSGSVADRHQSKALPHIRIYRSTGRMISICKPVISCS